VGTREGGVGEHAFIPNPIARDVNVFGDRGIYRRTSCKASVGRADEALGHVQSWYETLMLDLAPPSRLNDIEKAREFVAVFCRVRLFSPRNVFSDLDHRFGWYGENEHVCANHVQGSYARAGVNDGTCREHGIPQTRDESLPTAVQVRDSGA
jgi:hypothetical protein